MTVPYTFANATGSLDLAELDANFAAVGAFANTAETVISNSQPNITTVGILHSVSVSGNVVGGEFIGNAAGVFGVPGANIAGQVANALIAGTVTTNAQPNITSVGILTSLSSTGDIQVGNVRTVGLISATGNITGNYYVGNGSLLTGVTATGVGTLTSLSVTGNITGGNILTSGQVTASANITGGNIITSGIISATGNATVGNLTVIGNLFDSSGPLNITTTSNGNISLAPNGTGIVIVTGVSSTTGNVTGGNILTAGTSSRSMDVDIPAYANITATGTYSLSTTNSINILIANNTGYTATINMPTTPADGQICNFAVHGNTVTLAVGTGTVLPTFAGSTTVGTGYRYVYRLSNTTWYRIG